MAIRWTEGTAGKWLELLQETVPRLATVAVIANPDNPMVGEQLKELKSVAPTRRLTLRLIEVRDPRALDRAFAQARLWQADRGKDLPRATPLRWLRVYSDVW